jgi:hypothetical protein
LDKEGAELLIEAEPDVRVEVVGSISAAEIVQFEVPPG